VSTTSRPRSPPTTYRHGTGRHIPERDASDVRRAPPPPTHFDRSFDVHSSRVKEDPRDSKRPDKSREPTTGSKISHTMARRPPTPPYASRADPSYATRIASLASVMPRSNASRTDDMFANRNRAAAQDSSSYSNRNQSRTNTGGYNRSSLMPNMTDSTPSYGGDRQSDSHWTPTGNSGGYSGRSTEGSRSFMDSSNVNNAVWPPSDTWNGSSIASGTEWNMFGSAQPSSGRYETYRRF
jgi:hypothetical protein